MYSLFDSNLKIDASDFEASPLEKLHSNINPRSQWRWAWPENW
jgi:hypothetical protein